MISLTEFSANYIHFMSFVLGLVIGSFLNVVIYRLPRNQSVVTTRSHCIQCNHAISWWHNVPVLGFLLLRGKCAFCKVSISPRYPIVELVTATLFLVTEMKFGPSWILIARHWPLVSILVAVTFIDLEHRIIPDSLSLGGLVLGLLTAPFTPDFGIFTAVTGAMLGFFIFYFFAWLYYKYSGQHGLGGGDVKLLAMLGAFLGPFGVLQTILISSIFGSIIGIAWGVFTRQKRLMNVAIPYGPFLVLGALWFYLIGEFAWLRYTTPT